MKNENNAAKQQNPGYESKNEVDEIQSVSLGFGVRWFGTEIERSFRKVIICTTPETKISCRLKLQNEMAKSVQGVLSMSNRLLMVNVTYKFPSTASIQARVPTSAED